MATSQQKNIVTPAKAGVHLLNVRFILHGQEMDSRLRGNDEIGVGSDEIGAGLDGIGAGLDEIGGCADIFLPGTGRWQPERLTEGSGPLCNSIALTSAPSTTSRSPSPCRGEIK